MPHRNCSFVITLLLPLFVVCLIFATAIVGHADDEKILFNELESAVISYESKDWEAAIHKFQPLAESGNSFAQFQMGLLTHYGYGVEKSASAALKWFLLAAEQNNPEAQYWIAKIYLDEMGKSQEGLVMLEKAAYGGHIAAQNALALMYRYGTGGAPKDYEKSAIFAFLGALKGDALSQYVLFNVYKNGEGFPKNTEKAVHWLIKAADNNEKMAQFELAVMYREGFLVEPSKGKAIEYFQKALCNGYAEAKDELAQLQGN